MTGNIRRWLISLYENEIDAARLNLCCDEEKTLLSIMASNEVRLYIETLQELKSEISIDENADRFELIDFFGEPALFAEFKVDKSSVPQDLFLYEIKGDDWLPDKPWFVKENVTEHFIGCIICMHEISLDVASGDSKFKIISSKDIDFYGADITIEEFQKTVPQEYKKAN